MTITVQKEYEKISIHVKEKIEKFIKQYQLKVNENAKDNLVIHLSLSIIRELSGNYIETSYAQIENCKSLPTYLIAKKLVSELDEEYGIQLNKIDYYYTAMYLSNMDQLDLSFDSKYDIIDDEMDDIMDETLEQIKLKLGVDLKQNNDFYKAITLHFYPALERLKQDHQLNENPLSDMLNIRHEKEYQCAEILNDIVDKYYHKKFNNNELGYITLHFGTAFYKNTTANNNAGMAKSVNP